MDQPTGSSMRSVQRLIWHVVKESLKDAEHDEVKRAVGSALIDENEALFEEAKALDEILADVHLDTTALLKSRQLCSNVERSLIETEILLIMDKLRSCVASAVFASSAAKERDPESVLRKVAPQDEGVYDYLTCTPLAAQGLNSSLSLSHQHRPSTASSRPPTASTLSRPSTASSTGSAASQQVDPAQLVKTMQAKLSIFCIDQVKEVLRGALEEERAALMEDIEYLTAVLNDETDLQAKAGAPVPSLSQLKAYSSKLRELVAAEESRLQHEHVVAKMFHAAQSEASKASKLRRMVSASRTGVADGSKDAAGMAVALGAGACRSSINPAGTTPLLTQPAHFGSISTGRPRSHDHTVQGVSRPGSGTQDSSQQHLVQVSRLPASNSASDAECLQGSSRSGAGREAQAGGGEGGPRRLGRSSSRILEPIHAVWAGGAPVRPGPELEQTGYQERLVVSHGTPSSSYPHAGGPPDTGVVLAGRKPVAGSLLDAQADLLKGGVAAILAKHNYQTNAKCVNAAVE